MENIYKRQVFSEIEKYLFEKEIIVLHGARQVGKTSTMMYFQKYLKDREEKTFYIDLEDSRYLEMLNNGHEELILYLEGKGVSLEKEKKIFVFIDEIQYLKDPSSFLKLISDHHKQLKLIISGSSTFEIKNKFKNSLVGRTISFEIYPLSFSEFLYFKNYEVKLHKTLTKIQTEEIKKFFEEFVLYGGYPAIVLTKEIEKKEKRLQQIIDTYIKKDIRDLANIKDLEKFNKLLRTLAMQSGNLLNISELSSTVGLSKQTIEKHLFVLENTYVLKLVQPFSGNIRTELFKRPKIFFYDTGIMQMLWLKSLQKEIIGNVFETSIFTELVKKYGKDNINFWRTKCQKEIDFILKKEDELIPIEVKLNPQYFSNKSISYFTKRYKVKKQIFTGLRGKSKKESFLYPWLL